MLAHMCRDRKPVIGYSTNGSQNHKIQSYKNTYSSWSMAKTTLPFGLFCKKKKDCEARYRLGVDPAIPKQAHRSRRNTGEAVPKRDFGGIGSILSDVMSLLNYP
jgi:hypothetical protein